MALPLNEPEPPSPGGTPLRISSYKMISNKTPTGYATGNGTICVSSSPALSQVSVVVGALSGIALRDVYHLGGGMFPTHILEL